MKNLIRKILRESDVDWISKVTMPSVFRVTYSDGHVEGYFTAESFNRYLEEMNLERYGEDKDMYEHEHEFDFEEVQINW